MPFVFQNITLPFTRLKSGSHKIYTTSRYFLYGRFFVKRYYFLLCFFFSTLKTNLHTINYIYLDYTV